MKSLRLDKYLADMGIGTRSEIKEKIKKGPPGLDFSPACCYNSPVKKEELPFSPHAFHAYGSIT